MEISEEILRKIVKEVILEIENKRKKNNISKQDMYVVLADNWDVRYETFFSKLKNQHNYRVFSVIPSALQNKISEIQKFSTVILREDIDLSEYSPDMSVFPVVSQNIIAKTALAIDDTFETKWIRNCFSKGKKVVMLSSGLDFFTGKEPKRYISKIKEYYKTILEYGIEIVSDKSLDKPQNLNKIENVYPNSNEKKVITANDVVPYSHNGVLLLNKGDIITDFAKDRAQSLGITVSKCI